MKKTTGIAVGISIFVIAVGLWQWQSEPKTPDSETESVQVKVGTIESIVTGTGSVVPANRVEIKPTLSGRIEEILVAEGASVQKGQTIAWMSSTERAAILDYARSKGPTELKKWQSMYRAAPIVSPITGTIIVRSIEPGQTVAQSDAMMVVSDALLVEVQIDETDIGKIKLGQPVKIELDAYPNQLFSGRVTEISYESQLINNVTVYIVKVIPQKPPSQMRSGMTAYVSFTTDRVTNRLVLPNAAISRLNGQPSVWIKGPDEKPVRRSIQTGVSNDQLTEVRAGLSENDTVLIMKQSDRGKRNAGGGNPLNPTMGRGGGSRGGNR